MNKKGLEEIGTSFVLPFMFVSFVLLVVIFFLLFSWENGSVKGKNFDSTNFDEVEIEMQLMNFLKTPVEVDGEKMMMADFILVWYDNQEKYNSLLETESNKVLSWMSSPEEFYYVGITGLSQISEGEPNRGKTKFIIRDYPPTLVKEREAVLRLPAPGPETEIEVALIQKTTESVLEGLEEVDTQYTVV